MQIGLQGTNSDIELEVIKETDKAYLLCNIVGDSAWFPKRALDSKILNAWGMQLYEEKFNNETATKQNKEEYFDVELTYIQDESVRNWTVKAINSLPNYTFHIPASSSGNYHPNYALGEGGLVRHIKAATRIASHLFVIHSFTDEEKDIIFAALLLHDGVKDGLNGSPFTVHDHPLIVGNHLRKQNFFNEISQAEQICEAISSHMGRWTTSKRSKVVLPEPKSEIQRFVHLCDYLASRKCLEFNFEV